MSVQNKLVSILNRISSTVTILLYAFIIVINSIFAYATQEDTLSINITIIIPDCTAPMAITDLNAVMKTTEGAIELNWTAPTEDGTVGNKVSGYIVKYATFSVNSLGGNTTSWWNNVNTITGLIINTANVPGTKETATFAGLDPGVLYYFSIRSWDDAIPPNYSDYDIKSYSVQASTYATDIVPVEPTGLKINVSTATVTINWNNMHSPPQLGYLDFDYYKIYRSTNGIDYIAIATTTETNYSDVTVVERTTYYYCITGVDKPPLCLESVYSEYVTGYIEPSDKIPPESPTGVKATLSSDRRNITITWTKTTKNIDGTPCSDLFEYRIYRSNTLDGTYSICGTVNPNKDLLWTDPEDIYGKIYYYYVTAIDTSGNESKPLMYVDSSYDTNTIFASLPDCSIITPNTANYMLYHDTNKYGKDIKIEIVRNENEESNGTLRSFDIIAKSADSNEIINDFVFDKSLTKIVISYGDITTYIQQNRFYNSMSGSEEEWTAKNLAVFWFNGIDWIKLDGDVDPYHKIIIVNSQRIGKYMVKISIRSDTFVINDIQPHDKIFTPNNDGWNDYLEIVYANPKDGLVYGKIYDIRGALVSDMTKGSVNNSLKWDGKDKNGNSVPGGVYIYQIEITGPESKIINGTCIIAK